MSGAECPLEIYTDTPEFAALSFHISTVIDVPLNVYGIYLILFKSSAKMGNLKFALLTAHLTSTFCDFYLGTLTVPYVFFPLIAFTQNGLLKVMGVDPAVTAYIAVVFIAEVAASFTCMFENRHFYIIHGNMAGKNSPMKPRRRIVIFFNYVFPFLFPLPVFLSIPDQEIVAAEALKVLKCPTASFWRAPVFLATQKNFRAVALLALALSIYCAQMLIYVFHSIHYLHKQVQDVVTSVHTRNLERKYYYSVCLQVTIPFCFVASPAAYFAATICTSFYNQTINNIAILVMSNHGLMGTATMILIYKEFRESTKSLLFWNKQKTADTIGKIFHIKRAFQPATEFSTLS